jgi:hypothetical protein
MAVTVTTDAFVLEHQIVETLLDQALLLTQSDLE